MVVAYYATECPVASDAELADQVPLIDAPDDNAQGRYRSRASDQQTVAVWWTGSDSGLTCPGRSIEGTREGEPTSQIRLALRINLLLYAAGGGDGKIDYNTVDRERTCTDPSRGLISQTYQTHASAPVAPWR
jgi:hypothetical protein